LNWKSKVVAKSSTPISNSDTILKLLSLLLQYPDEVLLACLPEIGAVAADLPEGAQARELKKALLEITGFNLLALQELYTTAFDLTPASTLNLTYHAFGDNEKRAAAMVRLHQAYAAAGFETVGGELPDFLPLMLEFLSACRDARLRGIVWAHMAGLDELADHLPDQARPYAALLKILNAIRTRQVDSAQPEN
jgi:nitrate reductase delta subunit